jgi:threonine dehydrogenase-like Zn-dependent dehydrogenase
LQFQYSLPRIAATKLLGQVAPTAFVGPWAPVRLTDVPDPPLVGADWVRVRTGLAGICGSDLKQVVLNGARDNPMTALVSFPHVLGHEAMGVIEEVGPNVSTRRVGERVVLDPWLACRTRGIDPPCRHCQAGDHSLCENFDAGALPPGIHLGNNARVPGAFATAFVAHESQCIPIPDGISDETAVLADPFCVSLHSILRAPPPADAPALVYGLGALGLMAVAALRRLHPSLTIYAIGRYPHQSELARRFGADEILVGAKNALIERIAELTRAKVLRPWSGVPWLQGGVGVVYDTVGSPESIETSLRVARSRATCVVSGVEIPRRFEWTPLYFKEVALVGSNAFAMETFRGERRHAMDIYLELAQGGLDVTGLITHRFGLSRWRDAFRVLIDRGASRALKVVLDPAA